MNRKSNKSIKNLKTQVWSLDIMLAVIVFIGTIFFFYTVLISSQDTKVFELKNEASKVINDLLSEDSDLGIVDGNKINTTKLSELLDQDYATIKNKLRIKNEFCIFFEDEDGNILYINISETKNYTGIGSEIISVSNIPCG